MQAIDDVKEKSNIEILFEDKLCFNNEPYVEQ
jgi:hypothetical protein